MANINNMDRYAIVTGTADNDNIYNTGAYSTITAAAGDDTIDNLAIGVKIYGGEGNDSISNKGISRVSVEAGAGDDFITNYHSFIIFISFEIYFPRKKLIFISILII